MPSVAGVGGRGASPHPPLTCGYDAPSNPVGWSASNFEFMQATVWVGIAAIAAASLFNVLTLRRSAKTLDLAEQAYRRTEERYQDDLLQRRSDVLREALINVSVAVTEFNQANSWYVKLLYDFSEGHVTAGDLQQHDRERLRPSVTEVYRTCQAARFAATEDRYVSIIREIEEALAAASSLITSHNPGTLHGVAFAAADFKALRTKAADRAADLIRIAHESLTLPRLPDET